MPWKETNRVEERIRFAIAVRREGKTVAEACRDFGISRPTGYKWLKRYDNEGVVGMEDRSSAPQSIPHKTSEHITELLVRAREQHPTWGPRKLRALLRRKHPGVDWPAPSTIGGILKQKGLVVPRKGRKRTPPSTQPLKDAVAPNELWSADFKGQFALGDGELCYPLTVTDNYSRMLLGCEALTTTSTGPSRAAFEAIFAQHGLPAAIRTDNGAPFASRGVCGLSQLSAWWLSLGIQHQRIEPGHPEQNGRHERFHLTLKTETARPPADDLRGQQERFEAFRVHFNEERPHEALGQEPPAEHHEAAPRHYPKDVRPPTYRDCDFTKPVSSAGFIKMPGRHSIYVSAALSQHQVGLLEVEPDLWLVRFANLDLGFFERGETTLSPIERGPAAPPTRW